MTRKRTVGELVTLVTAKVEPYTRAMNKVEKETKDVSRTMERQQTVMNKSGERLAMLASRAFAAVAAFTSLRSVVGGINEKFQELDKIGKTADKLGVLPGALQGLAFAAEQTAGVTGDTLAVAIQRMTRRISQAATGSGEAVKALNELGLSATRLNRMSADQQFLEIADAMKKVELQTDAVRLTFSLFDSEGVALVNTLQEGRDALEDYHNQLDRMGGIVSRDQIAKIEMANDNMNELNHRTDALKTTLAVGLAPAVAVGFEEMNRFAAILTDLAMNFEKVTIAIHAMSNVIKHDLVKAVQDFKQVSPELHRLAVGKSKVHPQALGARIGQTGVGLGALRVAGQRAMANPFRFLSDLGLGRPNDPHEQALWEIAGQTMGSVSDIIQSHFEPPQVELANRAAMLPNTMGPLDRIGNQVSSSMMSARRSIGTGETASFLNSLGGLGAAFGGRFMSSVQESMRMMAEHEIGPNSAVLRGSAEAQALEAQRRKPEVQVQEEQLNVLKHIDEGINAIVEGGLLTIRNFSYGSEIL